MCVSVRGSPYLVRTFEMMCVVSRPTGANFCAATPRPDCSLPRLLLPPCILVSFYHVQLLPFVFLARLHRRADEKDAARDRLIATRKGRGEEGLAKIRGPEWGITELDFEGDYDAYQSQEMKREYDGAGRGVEPTAYRPSHRAGQQSVSAQAWMQEVGDFKGSLKSRHGVSWRAVWFCSFCFG